MAKGDKEAREAAARAKHLEEMNEAKARKAARRAAPMLERTEQVKEDIPKILIVCEGKNTEPSYFEKI